MKMLQEMVIREYKYESEEERNLHVSYMESQGYECSGQIKKSDDDIMKKDREYYFYGRFQKYLY